MTASTLTALFCVWCLPSAFAEPDDLLFSDHKCGIRIVTDSHQGLEPGFCLENPHLKNTSVLTELSFVTPSPTQKVFIP